MHYFTYILLCSNNKGRKILYIGTTENLEGRLRAHKTKQVHTTKNFENVVPVYYEMCLNKTDARKRELQLKTGFGRGYINRRIENYLSNK